jgi:HK97 family phage prohead protease
MSQRKIETRSTTIDASESNIINTEHGDGMTLAGYPIVFDQPTVISEGGRQFRETIAPGALKRTLQGGGKHVQVLLDHGIHAGLLGLPLGTPTVMRTDSYGLYAEVPLAPTSFAPDLAALIRSGAISGQSFRFQVINDVWTYPKGDLPERRITEIRLIEFGPVVSPAYKQTTLALRKGIDPERVATARKVLERVLGKNRRPAKPRASTVPSIPERELLLNAVALAQLRLATRRVERPKKWDSDLSKPIPQTSDTW